MVARKGSPWVGRALLAAIIFCPTSLYLNKTLRIYADLQALSAPGHASAALCSAMNEAAGGGGGGQHLYHQYRLKVIGFALDSYASDNDGNLPSTLLPLRSRYLDLNPGEFAPWDDDARLLTHLNGNEPFYWHMVYLYEGGINSDHLPGSAPVAYIPFGNRWDEPVPFVVLTASDARGRPSSLPFNGPPTSDVPRNDPHDNH